MQYVYLLAKFVIVNVRRISGFTQLYHPLCPRDKQAKEKEDIQTYRPNIKISMRNSKEEIKLNCAKEIVISIILIFTKLNLNLN